MSTLEQRLYLGDRAKEVIENEVFVDAFTQIQNEVIEQWTNSPARDAEGRERLWTYLQMLKRLQAQLQQTRVRDKIRVFENTAARPGPARGGGGGGRAAAEERAAEEARQRWAERLAAGAPPSAHEGAIVTRGGERRVISCRGTGFGGTRSNV